MPRRRLARGEEEGDSCVITFVEHENDVAEIAWPEELHSRQEERKLHRGSAPDAHNKVDTGRARSPCCTESTLHNLAKIPAVSR